MGLKNLRSHPEWKAMADTIKNVSDGKPFIYVQNNGNWGDRLIHEGAIQFFAAFDIAYESWEKKGVEKRLTTSAEDREKAAGSVMLYGGSGSWGDIWGSARKAVALFAPYFHHTVVLPTTFARPAVNTKSVTYFRRDKSESAKNIPESQFCHDAAFFYDTDFPRREPQVDVGYFYRTDKEQNAVREISPYSFDLSLVGNYKSRIEPFLQIMSVYKKVSTDRLHVGIGAALLGLQTEIRPSAYWKVRAIFESSIEPNYDNVTLAPWD